MPKRRVGAHLETVTQDSLPAPVLPAATILVVRDDPAFEVLMVKRHHQIDFAAGALVFPGGKTHADDHDPAWAERALGWETSPPDERAPRVGAVREVFEESGILLGYHGDGSPFAGDARAAAARDEVATGRRVFLHLAMELDLRVDLGALTGFARWVTPDFMRKRFDTWFYIALAPPNQLASCDGWETVGAEWIAPAEALRLADLGKRNVLFPTRMNLKLLAEVSHASDAIARARARPVITVEPWLMESPDGRRLVIRSDAGYGEVSELLSRALQSNGVRLPD